MNARHLHPSARKNTAAVRRDPGAATAGGVARRPARARLLLPGQGGRARHHAAAQGRPGETDLLLCGHHYLVSRRALAAAGASVRELPGTSPDVASWIREAA